jgi:hypothetical protein
MKKLITALSLVLAVACLFALVSCAGASNVNPSESSKEEQASQPAESKEASATSEPSFLEDILKEGEVYVDLHLSGDAQKSFKVKIGDAELTASGKAAMTESTTFDVSVEAEEGKKFYVYQVFSQQSDNRIVVDHRVNVGIRADKLAEVLGKIDVASKPGKRLYIAILEDPADWDKNLNEGLNKYLNAIKPETK